MLCAPRRVWFDEQFQLAVQNAEGVHPVYRNPGYSDDPYPGGVLISGDPILVPNRSHLLPAVPVGSVKSSVPPLAEIAPNHDTLKRQVASGARGN